jgi:hypothetical protein
MAKEQFVRLQVTFELKLYHGRMDPPYKEEDTWLLYIRDQFTDSWINDEMLRPGEYVYVANVKVLPPE